jgi:hypothetical protein
LVWDNTLYAREHPGERAFLIPWLAGQTFLEYGDEEPARDPYGIPTAQRAQLQVYGRLAEEGDDPLRLYLPFFAELFFFPFALIPDYALARGLWMLFLEAALIGLAILSLRLSNWRPGRLLLPLVILFFLLSPPAMRLLQEATPVVFAALGVAGFLAALRAEHDEVAGALLILPLCQPDAASLFLLLALWWMILRRRWRILWGFLMTLAVLAALGFFLWPGWFMPFLRGLYSHVSFNPGLSPGRIMGEWWPAVGGRLGWLLTAGLAVVLFLEWRAVRSRNQRHFLWTACLTLAVTPLIGIPVTQGFYAFLFLPLTLILALLYERWPKPKGWGLSGTVLVILFVGLWIGSWLTAALGADAATQTGLFFALPSILILGLYWVRWWAIRPPRTWVDALEAEIKSQ